MATIIIGQNVELESTSFIIEYWYDRHQQYWVVQVFDEHDRELYCEVGLRKADLKDAISDLELQYEGAVTKHVK